MVWLKIEMDRGFGWEVRQQGEVTLTNAQIAEMLPTYCTRWPHRAFIDGNLVAECQPPKRRRVAR